MAAGIGFGWSLMWLHWWRAGLSFAEMALFNGVFSAVSVLVLLPVRAFGTRVPIAVGLLLRAAVLLAAFWAASLPTLLILAVPIGFGLMLFWIPFNAAYFSRAPRDHLALSLGLLFAVFPVVNATLPAVAGAMAASWGFLPVFAGAALFMALATLPLRGVPEARVPVDFRAAARNRARWLLLIEGSWQGVMFVAVPLATLLFVDRPAEYGAVLALFGFAAVAASLLLAGLSDRLHRRREFLLPITLSMAASTFLAGTASDLLGWQLLNGVASFVATLAPPFATSLVLESSREVGGAVVARELFLSLGRAAGSAGMALLLVAGAPVQWAIMAMGLLFLLYPLEVVRGGFYRKAQAA
jgi:hypothetical protein